MTRLMDKAWSIALAVKKADIDCEEVHLSLCTASKSYRQYGQDAISLHENSGNTQ